MNRKRIYTNEAVGIAGKSPGEFVEDFLEEKYPEFAHDPRRVKVIDDTKVRGEKANTIIVDERQDVAIDELPELAQADLKKEDPEEDEIEKTLASYGINISQYPTGVMYDFPADGNLTESVAHNGCQRWNPERGIK